MIPYQPQRQKPPRGMYRLTVLDPSIILRPFCPHRPSGLLPVFSFCSVATTSLLPKRKIRRVIDAVGAHGDTRRQVHDNRLVGRLAAPPLITPAAARATAVVLLLIPLMPLPSAGRRTRGRPTTTATHMMAMTLAMAMPKPATGHLILPPAAARLGAMVAALVGLHAAGDGLGRHAGADLDVGLFDAHAADDGAAARAAVGGRQHPLAVGVGQLVDGDDADAALIVATVTRAEADAPSCL